MCPTLCTLEFVRHLRCRNNVEQTFRRVTQTLCSRILAPRVRAFDSLHTPPYLVHSLLILTNNIFISSIEPRIYCASVCARHVNYVRDLAFPMLPKSSHQGLSILGISFCMCSNAKHLRCIHRTLSAHYTMRDIDWVRIEKCLLCEKITSDRSHVNISRVYHANRFACHLVSHKPALNVFYWCDLHIPTTMHMNNFNNPILYYLYT